MESRSLSSPTLDSRWFAAFAREHEASLRATAMRLCGNATDARDLVQETFERGLRNLDRYKPGTDGRAWLLTILHHLFIDSCRSRARERRADVSAEDLEERLAAPEVEAAPAWASISPEQLREALEKIPEEFRTVYRMHALENRSYIEIAERLGIPKATVGTRLIRARRKLKELLMPTPAGEAEGT
ncbi:RNA polymerase sigma factor [Pyxidicoccus parkwayensis]|uniref:RNA polymerase sigma factor n=1 Tax=Pyxidicoccus parkwayensis TaxID=2813578 RepID=UPI001F50F74D|nr:RNA polymerase sigma factor [Pyxidicoccus parkwaysis]